MSVTGFIVGFGRSSAAIRATLVVVRGRSIGAWVWVVALGCTRVNPAYDAGDQASSGASTSAGSQDAAEGPLDGSSGQGTGSATNTGGADASATGQEGSTGEPPPPEPPPVGPYLEPERLDINSSENDDDPTLTGDLLEIYFSSTRGGGMGQDDIWVSRRDNLQAAWDSPTPVMALNTGGSDNTPEMSLDGLVMLLTSDRDGEPMRVFMSTRQTRDSEWSTPVFVDGLSTPQRDSCPFITADLMHVYSCTGPLDLEQDLIRFDWAGSAWADPVPLVELNTSPIQCGAWLDLSRRLILFTTIRDGGSGQEDMWMATRPSPEVAFGEPTPIEGINSALMDDDAWLSVDGSFLFFASKRAGTGVLDIYVANRMG